jgi:hypothetical protein
MLTHDQVALPGGVEVDAGIASLLRALWELGLRTSYSCQGIPVGPGEPEGAGTAAYILFPQATDAFSFFSQTLDAISTTERMAQIVVDVRLLTKGGTPGWEGLKRGPAVSLELTVRPGAKERDLRGCVRFDPDLMPEIDAAFTADGA